MEQGKPEKDYTLVFCLRRAPSSVFEQAQEGDAGDNMDFSADGNQVMLGMKKRGFGAGKWNGFGGKLEPGETIEQAAIRELEEESKIVAKSLKRVGFLNFVMCSKIMKVHVYTCVDFQGEAEETEEMRPQWFNVEDVDYSTMWPDDEYWVAKYMLTGKRFIGRFQYAEDDDEIVDYDLAEQR